MTLTSKIKERGIISIPGVDLRSYVAENGTGKTQAPKKIQT